MKMWFPLVMVVAFAAIGTPLQAGIFDRLENDTTEQSLTNGGGEVVHSSPEIHSPAPIVEHGYSHGPVQMSHGYPFKTGCCESHNDCVRGLWQGYCSRSHGACDRMQSWFASCARGHGCKGGCGKGSCGKGGCATGNCGHGGIVYGKGFGHVQHGPVHQKGFVHQKSHVQRGFSFGGHVQHSKGFSGCSTCGQSPCGCHGKGHHQKSLHLGFHRRHFAGKSCSKGHGPGCGCDAPAFGKGKPHFRFGHIGRRHHCDTCGKSTGFGFGKGGCDCGSSDMIKGGWGHEGTVIWDKGHTIEAPQHGQPTPSYDPPVDLEIPAAPPTEALPVPSTTTGHSASIRRLPPVTGYRY